MKRSRIQLSPSRRALFLVLPSNPRERGAARLPAGDVLRALGVRRALQPHGVRRADPDRRRAARAGHGRAARGVRPARSDLHADLGRPELREAIAATYDRVTDEHVLAFAGAEEAMFWALQELTGPGDHAVVTVPNYQSMETLVLRTGADVDGLVLAPEDGWALDLDALAARLRPETTLVAVNFPNNPTGAVADRATFIALAELCDEHGIRLFSDEVYRGLELDPARTLPQAADLSERAVSLNVMSKAYGLPGLRIGWLACRDRALLERLERRKHYTSICNAGPSEHLATIALRTGSGSAPATGRSSPPTCPSSPSSSPAGPSTSSGSPRRAAASASRAC